MGQYDVHVFLANLFIPSDVRIGDIARAVPFRGIGSMDFLELIDDYVDQVLKQPRQPEGSMRETSRAISEDGAATVIQFRDVRAKDQIEAIRKTEETLLLIRDILAFRQLQRGTIAGFLTVQNNVTPPQLYAQPRRPYPILRRVINLPTGASETDIFTELYEAGKRNGLLRVYLGLYAESVAYSDTLIGTATLEARLVQTWALLETMAAGEEGNYRKEKVLNLFKRYSIDIMKDYKGEKEQSLIDIAYKWRNIIVHAGGCESATARRDRTFCEKYAAVLGEIVEDLSHACRFLIQRYAASLGNLIREPPA